MPLGAAVLIAQLAVTAALAGLIWTIQLIVYPGFASIEPTAFPAWHAGYSSTITLLVGPLMLAELALAGWLLLDRNLGVPWPLALGGLLLVVLAWTITVVVESPLHARLGAGLDLALVDQVVAWNWPRTLAWTIRTALAAAMLWLLLLRTISRPPRPLP